MFLLRNTKYEIYFEMSCLLVSLFGLFIRIYTVGYTPKNTSGRNIKGQLADTLNTNGIYSTVRHPLYLGNFFMWLGPALLTGQFWFIIAFILFYWVYYERIMFAEEQFLRKKFGETYLNWASNIPAFLPKLKYFKPNEINFSWKKILKKEKNGFLALFTIFTVFNVTAELIKNERNFNWFLIGAFVFSLFSYIVIKILVKFTKILNEDNR
jgi:hypothetical protein